MGNLESQVICGPSYRVLARAMFDQVRSFAEMDPWGPQWILTPTTTLATHLTLKLVDETQKYSQPLAGIRIVSLSHLVERLSKSAFGFVAPRWSPRLELLLLSAVSSVPSSSGLSRLNRTPGGFTRLIPTLMDLADAGFGSQDADVLLEVAEERDLPVTTRETLKFSVEWFRLLDQLQIDWQPRQQVQLSSWIRSVESSSLSEALAVEDERTCQLLIFGFYDFTDVNLETIASISQRVPLRLYLPVAGLSHGSHPAFRFSRDVLDEFLVRTRHLPLVRAVENKEPVSDYFLRTFPEGNICEKPEFLTFQRASGVRAEVLSAAVRIQRWLDADKTLLPEQILIVAPDLERYYSELRRVLHDFALPMTVVDIDLKEGGQIGSLQALERIWRDGAPAEWVFSYLRNQYELVEGAGFALSDLEEKLRAMNLYGGSGWQVLTQRFEDKSRDHAYLASIFSDAEIRFLRRLVRDWVPGPQTKVTVAETPELLRRIDRWLVDPTIVERIIGEFEEMSRLIPDQLITVEELFRIVVRGTPRDLFSDPVDKRGVLIAPFMRARGMTARALVMLGLGSDSFPPRVEEDPLFGDAARAKLADRLRALGHRLDVKSRANEEMLLLFFLLNTSAEKIHWVVADADENGKAVSPTPWVLRYLNGWGLNALDPKEVSEERVSRGPVQQAEWLYSMDPEVGSFLPPALAPLVLQHDAGTFLTGSPVGNPDAEMARIPSASLGNRKMRISVTKLEQLARCPYRFWAASIAGISAIDINEWRIGLSPLDWGYLIHAALDRILQPCVAGQIPVSSLRISAAEMRDHWDSLSAECRLRVDLLSPLFQRIVWERLGRVVQRYLEAVRNQECPDGLPVQLEKRVAKHLPFQDQLELVGKLDRVDAAGRKRKILDYKSGGYSLGPKPEDNLELRFYYRLQPTLYPWLCDSPEAVSENFAFLFLGEDPPLEVTLERVDEPETVLTLLLNPALEGKYFPISNEIMSRLGLRGAKPCLGCDFSSLCRRFSKGFGARAEGLLERWNPERHIRYREHGRAD